MKKVSRRESLQNPWNGATLPKCEFLKRKSVCKGNCWRQVEIKVFSKNFGALGT
jgi:hypothetical protein